MALSIRKQTEAVVTPCSEKRTQVESTEISRSIELINQSVYIFQNASQTEALPIISRLASTLSEIDKQCQRAHETLESETIRSSALRYKFDNMPSAIQNEILEVVLSARMSNKALIDALQDKLLAMEEETERLEKDKEITDLHTSVLVPTMKTLQKQYDSAIDYLNDMLTMRAEIQISLNEAKYGLEDINREVSELGAQITQLQEDLKRDTEQHNELRLNLTSQLKDTIEKRNTHRKSNAISERDLLLLRDELKDSEVELHRERRRLKRAEEDLAHSRSQLAMLDNECESCSLLLQTYSARIPELRAKRAAVRKEMNEKQEKYQTDIATLCGEVAKIDQENEQLRVTKKRLEKEVRAVERSSKSVHNELTVIRDVEKKSKNSLLTEADEATRLRQENIELQTRYENLQETHSAGIVAMRDKIAKSKELLEKRTEERQNIETRLQSLQASYQAKREEEVAFIATSNQRMSTAQEDLSGYTDETVELEQRIAELSSNLSRLRAELDRESGEFRQLSESDCEVVNVLKSSISVISTELSQLEPDKGEKEGQLDELMEQLRAANDQYKLVQDKIIELKTQKTGLNERIQRILSETKALRCMQESLRVEILTKRADTKDMISEYSKEAIQLETALWEITNKVSAVQTQNGHFRDTIDKLSRDQSEMLSVVLKRGETRSLLQEEMEEYRRKLRLDWREDQNMERAASYRDRELLEHMSQYSLVATERKEKLSSVCDGMRDELTLLRTHLESLCSSSTLENAILLSLN